MEIKKNITGKLNSRCHTNCFKHSKEFKSDIYVGYFVEYIKGYISAIPHFFNVMDNEIIDTTLGSNHGFYFGKLVSKKYANANKMFDTELWKTLYSEKRIENSVDLEKICNKYRLNKLN